MRALCLVAIALTACGRRASDKTITPDPLVTPAKPPAEVKKAKGEQLVLFRGKVIDLSTRVVAHVLDKDLPAREAANGGFAYLLSKAGELRAYDMQTGSPRWSVATTSCSLLAASEGGAFCGKGTDLVRYEAEKGVANPVPSKSVAALHQLLASGGRVLVLRDDRSLESIDGHTGVSVGSDVLPFMPYGSREGMVANLRGACGASPSSVDVRLVCVDRSAKILYEKTYSLKKPGDPSSMSFITRQLDADWLVTSTWFSKTPTRGIVVRLSDGAEVLRVEEEVLAAVSRPDGALEGFFVGKPGPTFLEPTGAVRWTTTEKFEDGASAALAGDVLAIASFHPIATGASLRGFDRATGALRWTGAVELLSIGHSKYFNHVDVSFAHGMVVMRGDEAAQHYLELFDPKDGARTFSELRGR